MDLDIRVPAEEEYETWIRTYRRASGRHAIESDATRRSTWIEPDRLLAAYDDGEMVGTTVASSLELSIPGGRLPTARIDDVGVSPTHRRRGILTGLMKRQLRDIHERGEPLAMLEASESIIYGRFGFGIGVLVEDWSIDRQHTAFASQVERGSSAPAWSVGRRSTRRGCRGGRPPMSSRRTELVHARLASPDESAASNAAKSGTASGRSSDSRS